MNTLTKINFYLFVPAFSFVNIFTTDISIDLVRVIILTVAMLAINFGFGAGLGKILRLPKKTRKAFENSLMFYNSGNIGVSLITLVFSNSPFVVDGMTPYLELALSVQIMTLLVQNLTTNTLGFINSGGEGMTLKTGVARVIKMPTLYAIICAVLFKFLPFDFAVTPMWPVLVYLRNGLVSVALVTLGVQLSKTRINLKIKIPYLAAFCRLIGGPTLSFVLIKLFGFEGVMAQAIFIASSTPTAVNTALLSIECKGDSDFAVQTVTISTLLSAVTMTTVVYLAYVLF
jgi:predicted permease